MRGGQIVWALVALAAVGVHATEYELKRDTGNSSGYLVCLNAGAGFWCANDFDVSTLGANHVDRIKIMSSGYLYGPWDGFRIAIWDFDAVPTNIIWPESGTPKFVVGSGSGRYVWFEFAVGWTLPPGQNYIAVGQEQFFLPPYCDPFVLDDGIVHKYHTWLKDPNDPWRYWVFRPKNLMVRVILTGTTEVKPTSLGRVKAIYR
jgi:hypothetical protein